MRGADRGRQLVHRGGMSAGLAAAQDEESQDGGAELPRRPPAMGGWLGCMTLVTWELLPGETVEEFVAEMLLLKHPHGNRIARTRRSRLRVADPDGYDIYQVKRFCRPLTSRQVEESWQRFVDETLPNHGKEHAHR